MLSFFFASLWFIFVFLSVFLLFFFFNDTATTEIYTLSLHDALPIFSGFGYRIPRLRYLAPWGFEPDSARRTGVTGRIGVNISDGVRLEVGGNYSFNRAQYDAAFLPFPDTPSR